MKSEFENKTICFLGDSHTGHGDYIYYLRAYFQKSKDKCFVYNCGTGGNRVIMSQYILDDELNGYNPDYVVVNFGANDLGIWLYDNDKPVTEALIAKRKLRDDEYFLGYKIVVDMIKQRGIIPILASSPAVDQFLIEKEDIETLADNKEKEDYIGPSFYKRKTFENINVALKGYADGLKRFAQKENIGYIPIFEKTFEKSFTEKGVYSQDGIHLTKDKGYAVFASAILEFLGCENIPDQFVKTPENDEIFRLEYIERKAWNIRRATPYNPMFGKFTENDIEKAAKELLSAPSKWQRDMGECYFKYRNKIAELRKNIRELTENL